MSLLGKAKQIAAEFEYTDEDVRKGVKEFIWQMSMFSLAGLPAQR
jgi:hexokinase